MVQPRISCIAAMAQNRVIGKDNALIWHIPEDLKHFKRTTLGKPMIMGRKCYESFGRPLPGRPNMVVSRTASTLGSGDATAVFHDLEGVSIAADGSVPAGPYLYRSIPDAVEAARRYVLERGLDEIFIIGGGEIYAQTMDSVDRIYLTVLHRDYEGDAYFPDFDRSVWSVTQEDRCAGDPDYTFYTFDRRTP